jgi:spermidine/putrescine transport system ATP-binding protein
MAVLTGLSPACGERVILAAALCHHAPAVGSRWGGGVDVPEIDVRLERVSKLFGDAPAVDDLSLDIEEGEFFSMLGPSGCGKTTTLRMIGGFEEPSYGTVYLGGRDVTDLPPYKRDVNTVFQSYALFPHLDVYENVAFGLRRKKVDKDEIERRVKEVMALVDMVGFEKRKPPQMSGGQQQRVALARALVNHPKVLLLDEPLGALDLKLRKQMQLELKRIQQEVGITFIYVTHDQEEAMTMSNRFAVMRHGKIEQIGPPEEVYEYPATEFVAGFLGASNLLEGTIGAHTNGTTRVDLGPDSSVLVPSDRLPSDADARIKVGVRPEKITIEPDEGQPSSDMNHITGLLRMSTYIGVSHQYKVEGPDGTELTVYVQNLGATRPPQPGDRVRLMWRPEHTFAVKPSAPLTEEEEVE